VTGDVAHDPLQVVAAVIENDGRILVCRRAAGRHAAGKWEFPGGKVEAGEEPADALRREIREELDVTIAVGALLTSDETVVDGRAIRLSCFRAGLAGPPPRRSTDHDRLEWVAPRDLGGRDWAAPDLPAVELLIAEAGGCA
jgi:8-oxo-dGTP diphosphatase